MSSPVITNSAKSLLEQQRQTNFKLGFDPHVFEHKLDQQKQAQKAIAFWKDRLDSSQ